MKAIRSISFSLMGVIILLLIAGSIVEQFCGTAAAVKYVYTAPWTICLWGAAAVSAMIYMSSVRMYRQVITCLLHFSFVVILGGALVTHIFGEQGEVHLRLQTSDDSVLAENSENIGNITIPFRLSLLSFHIDYYPGTNAPMDFVSDIEAEGVRGQVSMNHIFTHRHYRFYQAMYDNDMQGVTLRVSHDPWGIAVTYAGYCLLLFSICLFFFQRRTHFRALLDNIQNSGHRARLIIMLLLLPAFASAAQPPSVSRQTAGELGNLYVYYNDRVCPLSTLAKDFTVKLCGKPSYKGLSAEEVLCGWMFYYDKWAKEPCIKIKGRETRAALGIQGRYACLNDFTGRGLYKLEPLLRQGKKDALAADEKFQLVSMVCTGSMIKIFPLLAGQPTWYSWVDRLPKDTKHEDWQFVTGSIEYLSLCVARNANTEAQDALRKIRIWQEQHAGTENLPSNARFRAEQTYNHLNITRPLAMACACIGLILFFVCCLMLSAGRTMPRYAVITLFVIMLCVFVLITLMLTLRRVVSGHMPLSNGHETMQFLAWVTSLLTLIVQGKHLKAPTANYQLFTPMGFLICGMTLMVSMMSQSNPQITHLMPVLQSPLLTLHVAVIMISYCLLAFVMLNGIAALVLKKQREQLQAISQLLLYPAVFLLAAGIFLGAVWANISWGRYWGWDPKEVWALITMLVYSALLHTSSLRFLSKPLAFHVYAVAAFLFVLFTYFGVNFLLGGMHSYA